MIAPACHPRIDEPVEARRQIFNHAAHLPSPWTGNGRHHPQSAAGPTFMREPWAEGDLLDSVRQTLVERPPAKYPAILGGGRQTGQNDYRTEKRISGPTD